MLAEDVRPAAPPATAARSPAKLGVREVDLATEMPILIDVFNRGFNVAIPSARFEWLYRQNPDGDATAWRMLVDGYLDATGVQDVGYDTATTVQAVLALKQGKPLPPVILDPGFVIHLDNMNEVSHRMWGAQIGR